MLAAKRQRTVLARLAELLNLWMGLIGHLSCPGVEHVCIRIGAIYLEEGVFQEVLVVGESLEQIHRGFWNSPYLVEFIYLQFVTMQFCEGDVASLV